MKTAVTKNGKSEVPTLRQLREMLPRTSDQTAPTKEWIRNNTKHIVFSFDVSDTSIDVYDNGFFTFRKGDYVSILRTDCFTRLAFDSAAASGGYEYVGEEHYLDEPWYIGLLCFGEYKHTSTEAKREKYHRKFNLHYDNAWAAELTEPSAEEILISRIDEAEKDLKLKNAFDLLTENQKRILIMYYLNNRKQADIADTLGINQQAVSRTLKRAISQLKKNF